MHKRGPLVHILSQTQTSHHINITYLSIFKFFFCWTLLYQYDIHCYKTTQYQSIVICLSLDYDWPSQINLAACHCTVLLVNRFGFIAALASSKFYHNAPEWADEETGTAQLVLISFPCKVNGQLWLVCLCDILSTHIAQGCIKH